MFVSSKTRITLLTEHFRIKMFNKSPGYPDGHQSSRITDSKWLKKPESRADRSWFNSKGWSLERGLTGGESCLKINNHGFDR